jgi:hypothetical protein
MNARIGRWIEGSHLAVTTAGLAAGANLGGVLRGVGVDTSHVTHHRGHRDSRIALCFDRFN